jgi:hypothetical protein
MAEMPLSAVALILDMCLHPSVFDAVCALVVKPGVLSRSPDHLVTGFLSPPFLILLLLLSIIHHSSLEESAGCPQRWQQCVDPGNASIPDHFQPYILDMRGIGTAFLGIFTTPLLARASPPTSPVLPSAIVPPGPLREGCECYSLHLCLNHNHSLSCFYVFLATASHDNEDNRCRILFNLDIRQAPLALFPHLLCRLRHPQLCIAQVQVSASLPCQWRQGIRRRGSLIAPWLLFFPQSLDSWA